MVVGLGTSLSMISLLLKFVDETSAGGLWWRKVPSAGGLHHATKCEHGSDGACVNSFSIHSSGLVLRVAGAFFIASANINHRERGP
jgi:hypothetical protein